MVDVACSSVEDSNNVVGNTDLFHEDKLAHFDVMGQTVLDAGLGMLDGFQLVIVNVLEFDPATAQLAIGASGDLRGCSGILHRSVLGENPAAARPMRHERERRGSTGNTPDDLGKRRPNQTVLRFEKLAKSRRLLGTIGKDVFHLSGKIARSPIGLKTAWSFSGR